MAKLFKLFQRLHTLHVYEGTGIGLASFQQIMQHHGDRIYVWVKAQKKPTSNIFFSLTNFHAKNHSETSKLNTPGEIAKQSNNKEYSC